MQDAHDLNLVIEAGIPLVALETWDEPRAIDLLRRLARQRDSSLFQWSITDGLKRGGFGLQIEQAAKHNEPEDILDYLKHRAEPGIYALCDFHPRVASSCCAFCMSACIFWACFNICSMPSFIYFFSLNCRFI